MKTPTRTPGEPGDSGKTIWIFTPSRTDPKDLEFILVQRQELLRDAVERVRESALTRQKHHLLFVGPRGVGKTHLVTLIVSRLSEEEALADRLRIAWLHEDETCTSLLELLVKIHAALEKRYPAEYREEALSPAYDLKPKDALEFVSRQVLSTLGSRTLLVVAENLDAIFEALGDAGQKQLRSLIQENPRLCLVATAQRLVADLSERQSPFFGFFQTEHLRPLDEKEATELLQNIARLQGQADVVEFLATHRGRARVRALHHLSGGNHRIYIVLSQFITRDSIDALIGPFMKMVDELTPYYQERLRWLPPLQRKIVEYLCVCEGTVPVKEIARKLFATPQTISSQLQDLREKGYVQANQRGRESLYEISEPLMRICVEVKENQNPQPLRLLVDFLRVWYDERELSHRVGSLAPASVSCAYLQAAIARNVTDGNLRKKILLEDLQRSLPQELETGEREGLLRKMSNQPEAVVLAFKNRQEGDTLGAEKCLDEALVEESAPASRADILFFRAQLRHEAGNREGALADWTAIVELAGAPVEQVAQALFNRGVAHRQQGETQLAIADYTAAGDLPGASMEQVVMALFSRGIVHEQEGDVQLAIADYTAVVDLPGVRADQVSVALLNRGIAHEQEGDMQLAIADYTAVVDLPGTSMEQVAMALFSRGIVHEQEGDVQLAIADYTAVVDLPGARADQVSVALLNRGIVHQREGEAQLAIADHAAVVNLPGAPVDQVATALVNRGLMHQQAGEAQFALADYTAVVDLAGAPVAQTAIALVSRGLLRQQAGDAHHSISDYTAALALEGLPDNIVVLALYLRANMFFQDGQKPESQADWEAFIRHPAAPANLVVDACVALAELHCSEGRWNEGFQSLEAGLKRRANAEPVPQPSLTDVIAVIFSAGLSAEGRREKVAELLRICRAQEALTVLGEAVVQHIGKLFRAGEPFPSADNLEAWGQAWEQAAEPVPEFRLSLRLLRTGIGFLKAGGKDPGILLTLTATEREILEQSLGLGQKKEGNLFTDRPHHLEGEK